MKALAYTAYTTIVGIAIYYNINPELYAWLWVFMLLDTTLGVIKAWRLSKWDATFFSSRTLKVGVVSKISILCLVLGLGFITKSVLPTADRGDNFIGMVLWLLCVAEFISMIQNTIVIKTGDAMTEYDAVSMVLSWLLWQVKGILEKKV